MDGQLLAQSLVSLKGTDLRMVYALLFKTNIGQLLLSKTKDLFSKEDQDHFMRHLEAEVKQLENTEDRELQVNLFLEITRLLKLRGTKYSLRQEIEDQCDLIVHHVYEQFKKQDKPFSAYIENEMHGTKLQQMIQFQMGKMFSELDGSFKDFTIEDQTKFASQVNEYIQSLPADKQAKIKDKLGIDDLTDEMIRKAIAASGTSLVFAIIVEVSGFAFYTTATSLVASFAGLFGLTLPFGFYTGLTSTVAVLANPVFLIPALLGGGFLLVKHQNHVLKKKLLPIIIMQIALPFMSQGGDMVPFEPFIDEWERRYGIYASLLVDLENLESAQKESRDNIQHHKILIQSYATQTTNCFAKIKEEKQKIHSSLRYTNLENLQISASFSAHRFEYRKTVKSIAKLKEDKETMPVGTGFLGKLGNKLSKISAGMDIKEQEKKLDQILHMMVDDILRSDSPYKKSEREGIQALEQKIESLKKSKEIEENGKQQEERKLKDLNDKHSRCQEKIAKLEKENYGLADLQTK